MSTTIVLVPGRYVKVRSLAREKGMRIVHKCKLKEEFINMMCQQGVNYRIVKNRWTGPFGPQIYIELQDDISLMLYKLLIHI